MRDNEILRAWKLHIKRDGYIIYTNIHRSLINIHRHKEMRNRKRRLPWKRDSSSSTCWDLQKSEGFFFPDQLFNLRLWQWREPLRLQPIYRRERSGIRKNILWAVPGHKEICSFFFSFLVLASKWHNFFGKCTESA